VLYRKIKDHPSVSNIYGKKLTEQKVLAAAQIDSIRKAVSGRLNEVYDLSKKDAQKYEVQELSAVDAESIERPHPDTAVSLETIQRIVAGITTFPADFRLHPKLKGFIEKRKDILKDAPIDWALGETLAFGSLVLEGTPVRLSGQDSGRGTFSQRHLEYSDAENGKIYVPLRHLAPDQARFDVFDSFLSEYAVMGFEFGYSVADPLTLVMWEAQFGDFANGAQILIDQFVASAESKWGQPSGLTLLLPHGYEGQGPEHSSARIERFLQLCAENNMQVVNASTPAQYFHVLRRQMFGGHDRRGMRKPLIIFTPKRMLRHPRAVSTIRDLMNGRFQEVIPDAGVDSARATRVLFCSGQVYYDLVAGREERKVEHIAIARLEQIYPFPSAALAELLAKYPPTTEVAWVQEEPRNMGAWRFVQECFQPLLDASKRALRYVGRPESASPATGSLKRHQQEQAEIVEAAFAAEIKNSKRQIARRRK